MKESESFEQSSVDEDFKKSMMILKYFQDTFLDMEEKYSVHIERLDALNYLKSRLSKLKELESENEKKK